MKIIANDYTSKDIFRILREWTELTQEDFAKSINKGKRTIQSYEIGESSFTMETLLEIAKKHNMKITIEK